jgi:hypothetical protein
MNISLDAIKTEWTDIKKKYDYLKDWKYFSFQHYQLHLKFNDVKTATKKTINQKYGETDFRKLKQLDDQLNEFEAKKMASTFKKVIARKFKDIADELYNTIIAEHTAKFSKQLEKLDTWMDANEMSPEQLVKNFKNLDYEFEKHFGLMNANIIYYWFYKHRNSVPQDWGARLTGFNRDERYLVKAFTQRDLESDLPKISDFSEFLDIVEHAVREGFEIVEELTFHPNLTVYYHTLNNFYNNRKDSNGNLSELFGDLTQIFNLKSGKEIKKLTILENAYQSQFVNATLGHPNLWHCVKRELLLLQDIYYWDTVILLDPHFFIPPYSLTMDTISDRLKIQSASLYDPFKTNFLERHAQKFIQLESSKIDSVVLHINEILTQHFKSKFDDWHNSQPYRKLVTLKYTYHNFDDFFRGIEIIFATTLLSFPEEDYKYLKHVEKHFDTVQKQADELSVNGKIRTRWDWGSGLRIDQEIGEIASNSAVSLNSPINVGFKTIMAVVEIPPVFTLNMDSILLMASLLLLKIKKFRWKF